MLLSAECRLSGGAGMWKIRQAEVEQASGGTSVSGLLGFSRLMRASLVPALLPPAENACLIFWILKGSRKNKALFAMQNNKLMIVMVNFTSCTLKVFP